MEGSGMSKLQREIQWRLSLYSTTPPQEVITQIITDMTRLKMLEVQKEMGGTAVAEQGIRKKLPFAAFRPFQDGVEEIDRYLHVFETQCGLQGIDKADWVTILISKLSGRALDAFEAIPAEDKKDYERIKERLLARYAITPEAHRSKFRRLQREEGQPYTEWAHQMSRSVDAWFSGCQATTLADAAQLVLLEQFYKQSPIEVRQWVQDQKPLTVDKAAELADQYMDTRRSHQPEPRSFPRPLSAPVHIQPSARQSVTLPPKV